ncbi:hypothetical protein NLU13_0250 [Sarocladium strictum]|uniref:ML-like domain-containing protein n=1 Tax=Sarocladium strictum TaxID=5046 RepID=A0AA39GRH1_SARSR|nr:hypothetical protein NLU13_0250 [Sarocladium strictum]
MAPWKDGIRPHGFRSRMSIFLIAAMYLVLSVKAREIVTIEGTGLDGEKRVLDVSRTPALYTGDFDDCLDGESLFNITKFDAAYYADNMTVLFHLDGTTNIRRENLMIHMAVEAYGESRFNMTYDPCKANIHSMCPLNASRPIEAFVVIPIAAKDVAGIPSIALGIPDLEGFARLQIYANSTKTMIGCFQAVMTNGQSFSQPKTVGSFLGAFIAFAAIASFLTAIYGLRLPSMRTHYAHSFSVLVIFETFQSMFLLGALSVSWPSVLPAWWSNFAWTAGMFAPENMVRSLSSFAGIDGNVTQVGGAGSTSLNTDGGMIREIYGLAKSKRDEFFTVESPPPAAERAPYNASDPFDYNWNGHPRVPGMPMPGTWPGFAGTLSAINIPPAEAFTLGVIWLLVVVAGLSLLILATKLMIDALVKVRWLKTDGFDYFRNHVGTYMMAGVLRTLYIAFFAMLTLSMYQFTLDGPAGPTAVSAIVFIAFLVGMIGISWLACRARTRNGRFDVGPDRIHLERGTILGRIPFVAATRSSKKDEEGEKASPSQVYASIPWYQVRHVNNDPLQATVHDDERYITRFGWLTARYRRTRWWFFTIYLAYQFIRAAFLGAGSRSPIAQVYGLFVFEIIALTIIIKLRPFEGNRNNVAAVWLLSISKIVSTGLSIAFLPDFNLNRIIATVIGIIIIIVQGFLAVAVMVLVVLGIISTWMSLSRNREEFSQPLEQTRIKYFEHIDRKAQDVPTREPVKNVTPAEPPQPSFNVKSVRRRPRMEDVQEETDGEDIEAGMHTEPDLAVWRRSRANSAASRWSNSSLPRAARVHRASWSSRDFTQGDADMEPSQGQFVSRSRSNSLRLQPARLSAGAGEGSTQRTPARRPMTPAREVSEELLTTTGSVEKNNAREEAGQDIKREDGPAMSGTGEDDGRKGNNGTYIEDCAMETPLTPPEKMRQSDGKRVPQ